MTPDAAVSTATSRMAADMPAAAATSPTTIAPTANPRPRHSRYTPTADPRHDGSAASATAASRVGYTRAVPRPSATAAGSQTPNDEPTAMAPIAAAWTSMPAVTSGFRPMRSDQAPVPICAIAQMAG